MYLRGLRIANYNKAVLLSRMHLATHWLEWFNHAADCDENKQMHGHTASAFADTGKWRLHTPAIPHLC